MYINIHTFICTFISLYMYIYKPVNVYFHYMQILSQCLGHPRTFISRWILEPALHRYGGITAHLLALSADQALRKQHPRGNKPVGCPQLSF